jgi:hypothetical protein
MIGYCSKHPSAEVEWICFYGVAREDDSLMSRRDLSQRSFVDAMVSGCGAGNFWTGSSRRSTGRRSRFCWRQFTFRAEARPAVRL